MKGARYHLYSSIVAVLFLLGTCAAGPAVAQDAASKPLSVEWTLTKGAKPLEREALLTVTNASGQPVSGVSIKINVDMPSMPMMHRVPTAIAEPAGESGRYKARFTVEMPGEWAAQIEISEPVRTKIVKKFNVRN
jgi:hypothetical protein